MKVLVERDLLVEATAAIGRAIKSEREEASCMMNRALNLMANLVADTCPPKEPPTSETALKITVDANEAITTLNVLVNLLISTRDHYLLLKRTLG